MSEKCSKDKSRHVRIDLPRCRWRVTRVRIDKQIDEP